MKVISFACGVAASVHRIALDSIIVQNRCIYPCLFSTKKPTHNGFSESNWKSSQVLLNIVNSFLSKPDRWTGFEPSVVNFLLVCLLSIPLVNSDDDESRDTKKEKSYVFPHKEIVHVPLYYCIDSPLALMNTFSHYEGTLISSLGKQGVSDNKMQTIFLNFKTLEKSLFHLETRWSFQLFQSN